MSLLKISHGTVYDPANGVNGEVHDVWIEDGRIVPPPADPEVPKSACCMPCNGPLG
jgi:formylmethanofuran dehydrogenase subunit A